MTLRGLNYVNTVYHETFEAGNFYGSAEIFYSLQNIHSLEESS